MKERRRHPRVPMRLPVETGEAGGLSLTTGDVSIGGVSCFSPKPVPEMTRMRLRIELPLPDEERWISAEAIVVRVDPPQGERKDYRLALFFTQLSDADKAVLRRYLETHYHKA